MSLSQLAQFDNKEKAKLYIPGSLWKGPRVIGGVPSQGPVMLDVFLCHDVKFLVVWSFQGELEIKQFRHF